VAAGRDVSAGERPHASTQTIAQQEKKMNRTNTLYLVIGALAVATVLLGYQYYQSQQRPQGVEISIGASGLSIQEK
jgi:RsiW-degrading membrane proteinase PrsW (M82 family)